MRQKGFHFFKIFNKIFVNHEQDHQTFDWCISSFTCLYDTLDNATAAYMAIHEWQESKKFDDPHKNVPMLDNNGQRILHLHTKLPLSFTWRDPILKIKKTDSESPQDHTRCSAALGT